MYIYPENLKAKPMLWLWLLRDIAIIGVAALISVLSLVQGVGMAPLVVTVLYAFLSIQVDGASILDFLRRAACFLIFQQQRYGWTLEVASEMERAQTAEAASIHAAVDGYSQTPAPRRGNTRRQPGVLPDPPG